MMTTFKPDKRNANWNGAAFEKQQFAASLEISPYHLSSLSKRPSKRSALQAVYRQEELVGYYGMQHALYEALRLALPNELTNEYVKSVLSRKIIPDEFLIVLKPLHLIILEKKAQYRAGSVDEKLQTAPFKLAMFQKLLGHLAMRISYVYILNAWYNSPIYRNIIEYYEAFANVQIKIEGLSLDGFTLKEYFEKI